MPFSVEQLLTDRPKLVTVRLHDPLVTAIDLMNEHDYSQLPVVDAESKPLGLVCSDTIVHALRHFQVAPTALRVSDAMIRAVTKRDNQELFDLLDALQNTYAVLIVNNEGMLTGIVTSYDTTDYFRRQTQDLIFVQDIELMLRDFVTAPLLQSNGETNIEALNSAIVTTTKIDKDRYKRFRNAVITYLQSNTGIQSQIDDGLLKRIFKEQIEAPNETKTPDQLTLYETIQIFLSKSHWQHYGTIFSLQAEDIQRLLDSVRKTRNNLMHFREISYQQHKELVFCKEWLARHQPPQPEPAPLAVVDIQDSSVELPIDEPPLVAIPEEQTLTIAEVEDEPQPNASRYDHLARWLRRLNRSADRVQLRFTDVEQIIESALPDSARKHRAWWANDSHTHVQSMSWLAADWRVSSINMDQELVTFSRIRDREQAYIKFFSQLNNELRLADNRFLEMSPNGSSWITVAKLKIKQRSIGMYNALFTRNGLFRLELYIDTEDKALNSALYEALQLIYAPRITEINEKLGTPLEWESLPGRRGVRIAVSHAGSITAKPDELNQVRRWGVDTMVLFYQIFADAGHLLEQHYQDGKSPALAPLFSQG